MLVAVSNSNLHGLSNDIRSKGAAPRTLVKNGSKHTAGNIKFIKFSHPALYLYIHCISLTSQRLKLIAAPETTFHGHSNDIRGKGANSRTLVKNGIKHTAGNMNFMKFSLLALYLNRHYIAPTT